MRRLLISRLNVPRSGHPPGSACARRDAPRDPRRRHGAVCLVAEWRILAQRFRQPSAGRAVKPGRLLDRKNGFMSSGDFSLKRQSVERANKTPADKRRKAREQSGGEEKGLIAASKTSHREHMPICQ
jgi:hypothetical protein